MPEIDISIGDRVFQVACQDGEEHFLTSAAKLLDSEASTLASQIGRLPEARMLLMAGLMLADKTAGLEEALRAAEEKLTAQAKLVSDLRDRPAPPVERIEVAVIPPVVTETLADIAAQTEALADLVEEKASA